MRATDKVVPQPTYSWGIWNIVSSSVDVGDLNNDEC